jgi:hypothetical protein
MQLTTLPEFHFLLVAPTLGAEWLFDAARAYWDRFRPTVVSDLEFVRLIPPQRSIAVTVIARRDLMPQYGVQMAQFVPLAYFDSISQDTFEDTKRILDERAALNQPFGAPIAPPLPTYDINQPIIPTPRLPPTRPPAGFVTATPSPTADGTGGESTDVTLLPLSPTPGPIGGG